MDLFREKYDLAEKNKKLTSDLNKIKNSITNYEKEIEELHKEIKMFQDQKESSQNVGLTLKDQESVIQANRKVKQYKELMDKRDKQITKLLQEKIKVKTEMDKLYQKLTSLINESQ
jgi:chromosome segregation ATPase